MTSLFVSDVFLSFYILKRKIWGKNIFKISNSKTFELFKTCWDNTLAEIGTVLAVYTGDRLNCLRIAKSSHFLRYLLKKKKQSLGVRVDYKYHYSLLSNLLAI